MIVGCYSIDLYCSNTEASSGETRFVCAMVTDRDSSGGFAQAGGPNERDCLKQLRARGWKLDLRNDRHFCPACVREGKVY